MADAELVIRATVDASGAVSGVERIEDATQRLERGKRRSERAAHDLRGALERLGSLPVLGKLLSTAFVLNELRLAIQRVGNEATALDVFEQVLENVGNTAQTSRDEFLRFARDMQRETGIAAQAFLDLGANAASFRFTHEVFYESIRLAADMAAAWGGDLRQNFEGLARALDDPIRGFQMLRMRGITLTDSQQALVESLIATGDALGAQRVVLAAIGEQIAGAAARAHDPLVALRLDLRNVLDELVRGREGSPGLIDGLIDLARVVSSIARDESFLQWVRSLGEVMGRAALIGSRALDRLISAFAAVRAAALEADAAFTTAFARGFEAASRATSVLARFAPGLRSLERALDAQATKSLAAAASLRENARMIREHDRARREALATAREEDRRAALYAQQLAELERGLRRTADATADAARTALSWIERLREQTAAARALASELERIDRAEAVRLLADLERAERRAEMLEQELRLLAAIRMAAEEPLVLAPLEVRAPMVGEGTVEEMARRREREELAAAARRERLHLEELRRVQESIEAADRLAEAERQAIERRLEGLEALRQGYASLADGVGEVLGRQARLYRAIAAAEAVMAAWTAFAKALAAGGPFGVARAAALLGVGLRAAAAIRAVVVPGRGGGGGGGGAGSAAAGVSSTAVGALSLGARERPVEVDVQPHIDVRIESEVDWLRVRSRLRDADRLAARGAGRRLS